MKRTICLFTVILFAAGALLFLDASGALAQKAQVLQVNITQGFKVPLEQYVVPAMKSKYNVDVVMSPHLSAQSLTKALAQKNNPEVSVFMLDEGPWLQGKQAGIWEKLSAAQIPNLGQIPARFRDPDGMGSAYVLYLLGFLYDEQALKKQNLPKPTSYNDLWNPAYKGKVTIPNSTSTFSYALLFQLNRLEGGDTAKSVDKGFAKLKTLVPNIGVFHGGASTLIPLFSQKQAVIAWNASFPAQQLAKSGVAVGFSAPKEGAVVIPAYVAIAKNAPNLEAAKHFVNLVLSPEYQKLQAELAFGGAVNPKTKLDPQFAKTFPITQEVVDKAQQMPWDIYNAKRLELNARYQREIETK